MRSRLLSVLVALGLCACGSRLAPTISTKATARTPAKPPPAGHSGKEPDLDSLFSNDKTGWTQIDQDQKAQLDDFASDYLAFLSKAGTQRQSAKAILRIAKDAGAQPFGGKSKHKSGELLYWQDSAQSSIALLKIGERPVEDGLRVIVASLDAGVIRLTPAPSYRKAGLGLFDTTILGTLKLESWLNTPLTLNIFVAGGIGGKDKEITIGDDDDEPVFTIPDLLPHLARKVQRERLIDSPERLDALAGVSTKAMATAFQRYGLSRGDWNRAEAELLPVSKASYVGVDRALMASPNHFARALPYAAARALVESPAEHTSLVILMGHNARSHAGADAESHVQNLLPLAIQQQRRAPDALALRRIFAHTSVMLFDNHGGDRNQGVVLNARKDDSTPEAFRHLLQIFEKAGLQYQIAQKSGWSEARKIGSLDLDAVEIGLPIAGVGTPNELLSTLDLYQALLACKAWVAL